MANFQQIGGAVVDQRLAPSGLSRLLGSYGARRAPVLVVAAALLVAAGIVTVLVPSPPAIAGLVYIVPVALIASELGTRAGLISAGLSIAAVVGWLSSGLADAGPTAVAPRALALLFLAWIIGRTSDRAAQSRELLGQVLEATTDSIYVKDLEGRYLLVNSAAAELIGRPGGDIVGNRNDQVLPDVAEAIAAQDAVVLEQLAPLAYEMSGRFGGDSHVLSVTKSPFLDASGAAVGSLGIARDITEQRRLQERFRRAFEDAPIGMALGDMEGCFLDVNQALCQITGYSHEDLCGRTFASVTHPDDLEADYAVMQALISGEASSSTDEKRYLRPHGGAVWVSRSVTLVRDGDGTPLHFLDQVQDITERRRLERELRRLAERDSLTGLLNRRRFEQELHRHITEVARYGPRGALLAIDLDHFKSVNDELGHHAGDGLLVAVASLLRGRLRDSDTIARLGGDEFAVLLPNASLRDAELLARRLVLIVREHATMDDAGRRRGITASVGVATFGNDMTNGEQILTQADLAMYEAKKAGGDRVGVALEAADRAVCQRSAGASGGAARGVVA